MYYDAVKIICPSIFILILESLQQHITCLPTYRAHGFCLPLLLNLSKLNPTSSILLARTNFTLYHVLTCTHARTATNRTVCHSDIILVKNALFFVKMKVYLNNLTITYLYSPKDQLSLCLLVYTTIFNLSLYRVLACTHARTVYADYLDALSADLTICCVVFITMVTLYHNKLVISHIYCIETSLNIRGKLRLFLFNNFTVFNVQWLILNL